MKVSKMTIHRELIFARRFQAGFLAAASMASLFPAAQAQGTAESKSIQDSREGAIQKLMALRTQSIKEIRVRGPLRSLIVCKSNCPEILSIRSRKGRASFRISDPFDRERRLTLVKINSFQQGIALPISK